MKAFLILLMLIVSGLMIALWARWASEFPGLSIPLNQAPDRYPGYDHLAFRIDALRDMADSADEVYRLVETFELSRSSVGITLVRDGGNHYLWYHVLERGGLFSGPSDTTFAISEDEWDEYIDAIEDAHFWMMPSKRPALGFDGITSILEGARNGRYHYLDRWSPPEESRIYQCFEHINLLAHSHIYGKDSTGG